MNGILSTEFLVALFGASFQELLYWNGLKKKLSLKTVQAMYKSPGYWLITVSVILASAIGVIIWVGASTGYELKDYALMGAAFPALFKLGVNSLAGESGPKLGSEGLTTSSLAKSYFFPEKSQ